MLRQLILPVLVLVLCIGDSSLSLATAKIDKKLPYMQGTQLTNKVKKAREQGKKLAGAIKLPSRIKQETQRAARQTAEIYHSAEFQQKVDNEAKRVEKILKNFISSNGQSEQKQTEKVKVDLKKEKQQGDEKIFLFLSSSMPNDTVHTYLKDLQGQDKIKPMMNGMVEGMGNPRATGRYFAEILKKDPDCIDNPQSPCDRFKTNVSFSPNFFSHYGIEQVPALIYDNGTVAYLIQGDASLKYLLERINKEAHSPTLKLLINNIRGDK